ncbi:hypothetical protein Tco_0885294 [Tanacetum coccineum]
MGKYIPRFMLSVVRSKRNVIEILVDERRSGDWDLLNTKIQQEVEERKNLKLWSFTKWTLKRIVIDGKGEVRNKKKVMENIMYFNNGAGPSSSIGIPLTQEEAEKRTLAHNSVEVHTIMRSGHPVPNALEMLKLLKKHYSQICLLHKIGCGDEIDQMLKISLKEAQSDEEIFFSMAWCVRMMRDWDCIMLRNLMRRLRSDENFNAREYWEMISIDRDLHLSRSSITSVRFPILRVLHKMITYGLCQRTTGYEKIQRNDLWLLSMFEDRHQNGYANVAWVIAKWMKRKGARSQKDSQICCGQFILKIARKSRVLTEETIRSLSTLVYYRDLDRTTLRELIDSEVD